VAEAVEVFVCDDDGSERGFFCFWEMVMKRWYARLILFFIRPALELHTYETKDRRYKEIDDSVLNAVVMDKKSATRTALESVYGLRKQGR